jgi:hypothetical protein
MFPEITSRAAEAAGVVLFDTQIPLSALSC